MCPNFVTQVVVISFKLCIQDKGKKKRLDIMDSNSNRRSHSLLFLPKQERTPEIPSRLRQVNKGKQFISEMKK